MISLIIPCIPEHLDSSENILIDYTYNTVIPTQTIISLSNTRTISKDIVDSLYNRFKDKLTEFTIIATPELLNRADNRNKGFSYAKYDIVTFSDADDRAHHQRIETILYFFNKYNIDCLLHSYSLKKCVEANNNPNHCIFCKNKKRLYISDYVLDNIDFVNSDTIYRLNYPSTDILPNVKNVIGWNKDLLQIHPHHGFPTVRKNVLERIKFNHDYPRGQDSLFCQENIYNNFKTFLIDADLMIYNNNWLPNLSIYKKFNLADNREVLLDLGSPNPPKPGTPRNSQEISIIREAILRETQ